MKRRASKLFLLSAIWLAVCACSSCENLDMAKVVAKGEGHIRVDYCGDLVEIPCTSNSIYSSIETGSTIYIVIDAANVPARVATYRDLKAIPCSSDDELGPLYERYTKQTDKGPVTKIRRTSVSMDEGKDEVAVAVSVVENPDNTEDETDINSWVNEIWGEGDDQ